ncbi:MAG: hypothetical protein QOC56_181 [Alphaproteobacteria bacterium]|nr:hypothetical protein [Alphaproteobacteria bacterium]
MSTLAIVILIAVIALVSSGAVFVILWWAGVIGTKVVAEAEEPPKPPR